MRAKDTKYFRFRQSAFSTFFTVPHNTHIHTYVHIHIHTTHDAHSGEQRIHKNSRLSFANLLREICKKKSFLRSEPDGKLRFKSHRSGWITTPGVKEPRYLQTKPPNQSPKRQSGRVQSGEKRNHYENNKPFFHCLKFVLQLF